MKRAFRFKEAEPVTEDSAVITTNNPYRKLVTFPSIVAKDPLVNSGFYRVRPIHIVEIELPRRKSELEQTESPITTVQVERYVSSSTHARLRQRSVTGNNSKLFDLQPKLDDKEECDTELSQAKMDTALSRSLVRGLKSFPQVQGTEGQELTRRLDKVTIANRDHDNIQRLLKSPEESNEKRHQALHHYLEGLRAEAKATGEHEFTESVIDIAWQVWERLRSYFLSNNLCLEVPDACPGQRNNFMYTWSKREHYFECEIFGSKEVEFFYRNRNSSEVWGEDTTLEQEFPTAVLDKAALFAW